MPLTRVLAHPSMGQVPEHSGSIKLHLHHISTKLAWHPTTPLLTGCSFIQTQSLGTHSNSLLGLLALPIQVSLPFLRIVPNIKLPKGSSQYKISSKQKINNVKIQSLQNDTISFSRLYLAT